MLTTLTIRNLALVKELEWSPAAGYTSVTGETGAGKSVILGALNLLLGERADKTLIRAGADQCAVSAVFSLAHPEAVNRVLEESGLDGCEEGELVIRRNFTAAGSNKQFVNGAPTTLSVLKAIGDLLVDLHGPHDHQSLLSRERQMLLLDAYAGADDDRRAFASQLREVNQLRKELADLSEVEEGLDREVELLNHQVTEIDEAAIQPGEEEELEQRYRLASNSQRLREVTAQAIDRLAEAEGCVLERLNETQRLLRELSGLDQSAASFSESHANAVVELEELAGGLRDYLENLDLDEARFASLEERVELFETLKRKYGPSMEDVLSRRDRAAERLQKIEGRAGEIERLNAAITKSEKALDDLAAALSQKRQQAAPELAAAIGGQLADLGFKNSEFLVELSPAAKASALGREQVEFLFAPNPGEPAKPLKAIGSSGEISRVMLAVKTALAEIDEIPVLIFDEIDANVGGQIAHAVGQKMRGLGESHQLFCITHLPQVAAAASQQFVVEKEILDDRTESRLRLVQGEERSAEIARMLGGAESVSARAHAEELLGK